MHHTVDGYRLMTSFTSQYRCERPWMLLTIQAPEGSVYARMSLGSAHRSKAPTSAIQGITCLHECLNPRAFHAVNLAQLLTWRLLHARLSALPTSLILGHHRIMYNKQQILNLHQPHPLGTHGLLHLAHRYCIGIAFSNFSKYIMTQ